MKNGDFGKANKGKKYNIKDLKSYKGVRLAKQKELAMFLNANYQSVLSWNFEKKKLMLLGLTFKKFIDEQEIE